MEANKLLNYLKGANSEYLFFVLISIALFLSVSTGLRFKNLAFGIGEVIVLAFTIYNVAKIRFRFFRLNSLISIFWLFFLSATTIGFFTGVNTAADSLRSAISFIYVFVFSLMLSEWFADWENSKFERFLSIFLRLSFFVLLFGFFVFLFGSQALVELVGLQIYQGVRFSAWSVNPNQIALFLVPFPILFLREANSKRSFWGIPGFSVLLLISLFVRSDALVGVFLVSVVVLPILYLFLKKQYRLKVFIGSLVMFLLIFSSFKFVINNNFIDKSNFIRASDSAIGVGFGVDKSLSRLKLWENAFSEWKKSPWFGNGPGTFSYIESSGAKMEAHNTFLDILTQAGVVGGGGYLAMLLYSFILCFRSKSPASCGILIVLFLFSSVHYTLRHPIFTFYIFLAFYLSRQEGRQADGGESLLSSGN